MELAGLQGLNHSGRHLHERIKRMEGKMKRTISFLALAGTLGTLVILGAIVNQIRKDRKESVKSEVFGGY